MLLLSNRLFEWLVTFINNSICADKSMWCNFIGKLSFFTLHLMFVTFFS